LMRLQSPARPFFTPLAPLAGMPDSWVDHAALYAGETVLRIGEITSAERAVKDLCPR
jgi:nitronate monooxygenase